MTYLPGLRESLVEAAQHRYGDAAEPRVRRIRRRWLTPGGVGAALAAVTALAVAAVAIVALGNRHPGSPRPASPTQAPVTRAALRAAAAQALGRLVLPSGAVLSGLVRGTPAELWSVSNRLAIPGSVDVYRIWRLHDTPDRVLSFIERNLPRGASSALSGFSSEASSSRPGGPVVVQQAGTVIGFRVTETGIWRELAINAVTLPGGGTALRVDSEAGWVRPRPRSERIPSGVAHVRFEWAARGRPQHLSLTVIKPGQVSALVSLFNSLPIRPRATSCSSARGGVMKFVFEPKGGAAPLAVATWTPGCQNVGLTIAGGPTIVLMAGTPTAPIGAQIGELLARLIPVRRISSTTVNSSQGCASSTSTTPARSQSAPGAAGASCTSASRSTTSATSH